MRVCVNIFTVIKYSRIIQMMASLYLKMIECKSLHRFAPFPFIIIARLDFFLFATWRCVEFVLVNVHNSTENMNGLIVISLVVLILRQSTTFFFIIFFFCCVFERKKVFARRFFLLHCYF